MPTEKALDSVKEVADLFASSSIIIATEYRGISVSEMDLFRASLRKNDCNFKIVKKLRILRQLSEFVYLVLNNIFINDISYSNKRCSKENSHRKSKYTKKPVY